MLLQGRDETGQDRLEALAADPVRRFPKDDQGFAYRLVVGPSINCASLSARDGSVIGEQSDCMFAMASGHGYEFVQDSGLLLLGGLLDSADAELRGLRVLPIC